MQKETKKDKEVINGKSSYALKVLIGDIVSNPELQCPSVPRYESKHKILVWRSENGLKATWKKALSKAEGAEDCNGEKLTLIRESKWQGQALVRLCKKGIRIIGWEFNKKGVLRPVVQIGEDAVGKLHMLGYGKGFAIEVYVK